MIVQEPVMSDVFYICSYLPLQCQMVCLSNLAQENQGKQYCLEKTIDCGISQNLVVDRTYLHPSPVS